MSVETAKKFVREYQPTDDNGAPIGPPQRFEADTAEELMDALAAAHQNATRTMWNEKRARKLGEIIEPDPEQPIQTFEARQLTADEMVGLAQELKNPATMLDANRRLLEAQFGAPLATIRQKFFQLEINERIAQVQQEIDLFTEAHPEYVQTPSNQTLIVKYLEKQKWAITKKNLEKAYEDLHDALVLRTYEPVRQAPATETPAIPEGSVADDLAAQIYAASQPQVSTAPATAPVIPAATTTTSQIGDASGVRTVPRGASGMSSRGSSVPTTARPAQAPGLTAQDIMRMSATEYAERFRDPKFRELVDKIVPAK